MPSKPDVQAAEADDAVTQFLDPLVLRARSRVGTTLRDKWRLDVLLGLGGMAAVYAATHRNGARAAVKLLHPELSLNQQVRSRFLREGYVANSVGHDGAVKVLDDDAAEDGSLFLVTELLDGETLEDRRLRFGGQLPEDEVLSVADQLLDVLAAAHAKGIVHRDLKPENVFLTRSGQVKVLDFGIARLREISTGSSATKSGATMGTPAFMAPEQARGLWDEVDARTDLWAVGATMFTLLSGRLVHEGRTTNEHLLSAMTQPAPPLASLVPGLGPAVGHLVDRSLAFDKDKRWPDASRMQEAVRHAYHDRHGTPITTSPRLSVPETVPNRTLADANALVAARLPTTGQPVETVRSGALSLDRLRSSTARLVGAGAIVVGLAILGTAWLLSTGRGGTPTATGAAPGTTATPIPSKAPLPSATLLAIPPEIAATDLPAPAVTKMPQSPPAATRTAPVANPVPSAPATVAPVAKPNCKPPFTLDSAGVKHWKAECL